MSNVLIVNSSFRKKSNSSLLSAQVASGAESQGHNVQSIDIGKLRIEPCRGCMSCMKLKSGTCVIKDDMQPLYEQIKKADILVFVSPIYWFNICGQLKQFIDRCFAIAVNLDQNGASPFALKKIASVLVYGDTDPFVSGAVNAIRSFQDICSYTKAEWGGAVYGSADDEGAVANDPELLEKARQFGTTL